MKFCIDNGSFRYRMNAPKVLNHVSLAAESGDLIAVLGPNGAGKTTMLRCAMGFLKWEEGTSRLDDEDISAISHRQLWKHLAYVPQARGLISPYTAEEMVLLGRSSQFNLFQQPGRKDTEAAEETMNTLGILHLKQRRCSELSGGELQMVLIARALASHPDVLILDEPESNLDFKNQLMVLDTLTRLSAQGMTCIFNTHYPAHAIQRANKALLLNSDGSSSFGPVNKVITEESLKRSFGVRTVISEVETPFRTVQDVIPIMMAEEDETEAEKKENLHRLAIVSIIAEDPDAICQINAILHEYSRFLIGRMGMPYPEGGVSLINLNIDATESTVREMTRRLYALKGVSVKAVFARSWLKGSTENE
ncbi:MAG: ATP-binding cassette domain-containing protein [Erysipelotrichia bacterium]|nr:ATP-binding cassette domain-containing protein [Erysipelotrichia bacterium]